MERGPYCTEKDFASFTEDDAVVQLYDNGGWYVQVKREGGGLVGSSRWGGVGPLTCGGSWDGLP